MKTQTNKEMKDYYHISIITKTGETKILTKHKMIGYWVYHNGSLESELPYFPKYKIKSRSK